MKKVDMEKIDTLKQMLEKVFETEGILRNYKYRVFDATIKYVNQIIEDGIVEFDTSVRGVSIYDNDNVWLFKIDCSDPKDIKFIDVAGTEYDMAVLEIDTTDVVDNIIYQLTKDKNDN